MRKKKIKRNNYIRMALCLLIVFMIIRSNNQSTVSTAESSNSGTYSESKKEEPVLYGISYVSKLYTAAAIMKLVDENKLELNQPVYSYISEFKMADERYKDITVRMLLNHTAGFMGTQNNRSDLYEDIDPYFHENFLFNLGEQYLKADPGEFSAYSNDGFSLAEMLVEEVSGISFTEYLEKEFFNPLNLIHTFTPYSSGYAMDKMSNVYVGASNIKIPAEIFMGLGAGGLISTAEDLSRFSSIFMDDSADTILRKESVNAMSEEESKREYISVLEGEESYGLGWDAVNQYPFRNIGIKSLSIGGDTANSYHSNLLVLPEYNMSSAVLSSGGSSLINNMISQQLLFAALIEKGIMNEVPIYKEYEGTRSMDIPDRLKEFGGYYNNGNFYEVLFSKDNTLIIRSVDKQRTMTQEYIYTKEGYFLSTDGDYIMQDLTTASGGDVGSTKITFSVESNGEKYINISTITNMAYLGSTEIICAFAQKIENNTVTEDVLSAWTKRDGKRYFLVGQPPASIVYTTLPYHELKLSDKVKGYIMAVSAKGTLAIKDEKQLVNTLILPGGGRDLDDLKVIMVNGVEYLKSSASNLLLMSEDGIGLFDIDSATYIIDNDLGTNWYRIGENSVGKKVRFLCPEDAAYYVYNEHMQFVSSSKMKNIPSETILPKDGYVVFIGEKGKKLGIEIIE